MTVTATTGVLPPLFEGGHLLVDAHFDTVGDARAAAHAAVATHCAYAEGAPLTLIGAFVLPPAGGPASRDFQTLHFDFGLPLAPASPGDVARITALHVPADRRDVTAVTRLVALAPLLAQRGWPEADVLMQRLSRYGATHGAWADGDGYVEGSFARIVEAAAGRPALPSVKVDPSFLCGTEFDSLAAERDFLAGHGLRVRDVEVEVALQPGQLLLFDNLAVVHGRRGTRAPGELRQWAFGHRALPVSGQCAIRDRVLAAFAAGSGPA